VHAAPWLLPIIAPPIRDGAVALDRDGRVIALGDTQELSELGEVIWNDGVLIPGLINAHTHVELSHLAERVPGGAGLVPWIRTLLATHAQVDAVEARGAAMAAARAMRARGTVAVADVTNTGTTGAVLNDAGLHARVFHEHIAPRALPHTSATDTIPTAHATYSCGATALRHLAGSTRGRIASIHIEEDPAEAAWLLDHSGPFAQFLAERDALPSTTPPRLPPVQWLDSLGVLGRGTLLVHLTVADADSLALASARGAIAVLCPRSNLHIGGRLPPIDGIRAAGLRVALGTDSLASSPSLDVLGEVQALARAGVAAAWALEAATAGGAIALGYPHLGAIAVGKRPGLLALGDDTRGLRDPIGWTAHEGADAPAYRIA
jgi:cytosine/adenosine deaminase-related metal-dependent hydrolase